MADLPWWGWVVVVVAAAAMFVWTALGTFRRQVRREFLDLLRNEHPDVEIVRLSTRSVRFRIGRSEKHQFFFARLYTAIAELGADDKPARAPVYRSFLAELMDEVR